MQQISHQNLVKALKDHFCMDVAHVHVALICCYSKISVFSFAVHCTSVYILAVAYFWYAVDSTKV